MKSFGKIRRSLIFRVLRAIAGQGREFLLLVALEPIDRGFLVRIRWAIVWGLWAAIGVAFVLR
ncbi:MAG: hypothetical protein NT070_00345 [Cyanobacteria bacterium]|nr:hypothetical protein [Cyanobacteriota bacterium]